MMRFGVVVCLLAVILPLGLVCESLAVEKVAGQPDMDHLWGARVVKLRAEDAKRGQLFDQGNYAMFIHWGLYSQLGNKVDGETYYGIGEWIMNQRMAGIPIAEYKKLANNFNPVDFDARAIAKLARDAGMKYIVITAKHHDGFAMYESQACDFNIVDATPWGKDPMKDLAAACREQGLGFGFYYSHNQDWTFPGGGGGPQVDASGKPATFDDYFEKKCLPQVREITTQYGPIEIVWFDTPGKMPKHYVEKLVEVVHKNQPGALVSGRAGHELGDYQTLGDMEVPIVNVDGLWESVDTTNDSWAYAWYDENWKSPKQILERLVACVARGGTYMLNIGPRGDGSVSARCATALRHAGDWIARYPQVIYDVQGSPWKHSMPWGDVTQKDNVLFLTVFEWPASGELYLPNIEQDVREARLLLGSDSTELLCQRRGKHVVVQVPAKAPESLVSVIKLTFSEKPTVDPVLTLDPEAMTELAVEFADVNGVKKSEKRWMEKFGEWKRIVHGHDFGADADLSWEVDVLVPGEYQVSLNYAGEGRLVWHVGIDGGESIQNQQDSSHNYQTFPIGWLNFPKNGRYRVSVQCLEGDVGKASLHAILFDAVR
ncbi:MAG TPA: alpha-L-fucosidase [Planctomycetaceae bacterium]|nr:alpha-L-fucosidase [Planctomycetaceae bacterium]|tara:strand:+ start:71 stop:1870 length:1800 start_codon:yes stop_codon:yes gene_type:complete